MAATDARPVPIKNTAFRAYYPILDADGDLGSSAGGLDTEVSIDGGAFSDATNEWTEIGTTGIGYIDLTSGEMNGDCIVIQTKTTTSGYKTSVVVLYPEETGDINVDVTAFGGTAATTSGGRPEVNTTHAAGTAWGSGAITAASIAADAITAAKIADGAIDAATFAAGAINATAIAADAIGASELAADAVAEIADQVWDEARAGHVGAGSFGEGVASVQGNVTGNVGGNVTGSVGSVGTGGIAAASFAAGAIDNAAIAADAIGSSELAATAAAEVADAVWDEATSGHTTGGSYGDKLGAHIAGVLKLVVGTGSTTTAIVFSTVDGAAPSATNDFYNGRVIVFTSGTLAGQATSISDYVGGTVTATVVAVTGAPSNGDTAVIV